MPKVFDNGMVAHVWAQRKQDDGRSHNGNFSFCGDTLYSYSTPIARLYETLTGDVVALLTTQSYSMTTEGKHKNAARRAVNTIFTVPYIGAYGGRSYGRGAEPDHAENVAHYVAEIDREFDRLKRARNEPTTSRWDYLARDLAGYCAAFGLELPEGYDAAGSLNLRHVRLLTERRAREDSPAAIKRRVAAAKRHEESERLARLEGAERVALWQDGKRVTLRHIERTDDHGGAYARVRLDALETSLGVTVPLADAIKVFRVALACREQQRGRTFDHDTGALSRLAVGHFRVDAIYADGSFKAGCHRFSWPEIERLALSLGLLEHA